MADSKISALAAVTSVGATDELVMAVGGATKKITGANLKAAMPGTLLGSGTVTTNQSTTQTVQASADTFLTATSFVADGSTSVIISCRATGFGAGASAMIFDLWESVNGTPTDLGRVAYANATGYAPLVVDVPRTPAAGTIVYTLRGWMVSAATGTILALAGTYLPATIRVTRA